MLKPISLCALAALAVAAAHAQPPGTAASAAPSPPSTARERLLFPERWARGFIDFDLAPPTNEPDLGRCAASVGQMSAAAQRCAAFARYMLSGYLELRPFGRTVLRRVSLFASPKMYFGNNLPQVSYTAATTPIAVESTIGAAIGLGSNFEVRAVRHAVYWLGRYRDNLGAADIGPNGPLGHYATLGVRWYFGGYGKTDSGR